MDTKNGNIHDIYFVDTDEEHLSDSEHNNTKLDNDFPTFYRQKTFFFDDSITEEEKGLLKRYIYVFQG